MRNIDSTSRGDILAPYRRNSLTCIVRTSRKRLCNQKVGYLLCSMARIYDILYKMTLQRYPSYRKQTTNRLCTKNIFFRLILEEPYILGQWQDEIKKNKQGKCQWSDIKLYEQIYHLKGFSFPFVSELHLVYDIWINIYLLINLYYMISNKNLTRMMTSIKVQPDNRAKKK